VLECESVVFGLVAETVWVLNVVQLLEPLEGHEPPLTFARCHSNVIEVGLPLHPDSAVVAVIVPAACGLVPVMLTDPGCGTVRTTTTFE
jgi:hypothetical protein